MGLLSTKCDNCGSTEHSTSDCPHGIISSKCANCGSIDHATSDCPHGIFSTKCSNCGSTEHSTSDCPHGIFSSKCANCGSVDHSTNDCPHGVFSTKCANCGSKNHNTEDCPQGLFAKRTNHETTSESSSSNESGCTTVIIWIIVAVVAVIIVIWLAVNIILPVTLLNSALALTVLSIIFKDKKKLFSYLALVGGIYMSIDIVNGWFSQNFVTNVVNDSVWITAFVYLNAIAIGYSTWSLLIPFWSKTKQIEATEKNKSILLKIGIILLVIIATCAAPFIYYNVRNPFVM